MFTCRNFSGVWWHPDLLHAMLLLIDQQIRIYIKINIWPVYNVGHFIWWTVITDHKRVGRRWGEDFSPYYPDFLHVMAKCKVAEMKGQGLQLVRRVLHVNVKELITLLIIIIIMALSFQLAGRCCGGRVCHRGLLVCSTHRKSGSDSNQLFPASRRSAAHTHTPACSRIFVRTLSDVIHSSLPTLTKNKTTKYRNQTLINQSPLRLI